MKTNISKVFIKLVKKHFLKSNKYNQLFNLNTLRPSYYCTINVGNIIKQHNCKVLSETNDNHNRKGNWKSKPNFPLSGGCLAECLEYKVISTTSYNSFVYYGLLKGSSKHGITTLKIVQNHDCINIIKTCAGLKRPWLWEQSIMNNPQKGLTIQMWFKTLRSMFIRKSFQHLCWSRHAIKQKNWINFQVSPKKWIFVSQRYEIIVIVWFLTICTNSVIKTPKNNWFILCCGFCKGLVAGRPLPVPLLIRFHGLHSWKQINNFHMTIICYYFLTNFFCFLTLFIVWRSF